MNAWRIFIFLTKAASFSQNYLDNKSWEDEPLCKNVACSVMLGDVMKRALHKSFPLLSKLHPIKNFELLFHVANDLLTIFRNYMPTGNTQNAQLAFTKPKPDGIICTLHCIVAFINRNWLKLVIFLIVLVVVIAFTTETD